MKRSYMALATTTTQRKNKNPVNSRKSAERNEQKICVCGEYFVRMPVCPSLGPFLIFLAYSLMYSCVYTI